MNSLLQREIDAIVTKQARHAIAQELKAYREVARWHRRDGKGGIIGREMTYAGAKALTDLAREHFPREHGRECLRCGKRPVMSYYGQVAYVDSVAVYGQKSADFCQSCQEHLEDGEQVRRYW